ncbi:MAG: patatin-like phospholipase family protein [Pyramidobacter sp.]|nr:patatin-like phospholipase family protein [Pyramidobacter sp.]
MKHRVGLVLSGGGARGAYQAGIVQALAEGGISVDVISGASIGGLNGAVLSAAPTFAEGAQRLVSLWQDQARRSPLIPIDVKGLFSYIPSRLKQLLSELGITEDDIAQRLTGRMPMVQNLLKDYAETFFGDHWGEGAWLSSVPLEERIDRYVDFDALARGIPLYLSLFPASDRAVWDVLHCFLAELSLAETPDSEFFCIQKLPREEYKKALLASAALPLIFAPQVIEGRAYSDGGQGGWRRVQGNTPVEPLIRERCDVGIVSRICGNKHWNAANYPDIAIVDIRPRSSLKRNLIIPDTLGFTAQNILSWIEQGYEDARSDVPEILQTLEQLPRKTAGTEQ